MKEEKVISTCCNCHCGGACLLKVYVRDGKIARMETDDGGEPQLRACLKGRAYRQRVYDPKRLQFPLKRVGKRGDGKFEQISWNEALDLVANQIRRIQDNYGPASIIYKASGGDLGLLHGINCGDRFFCMAGGYSRIWGTHSYEGCTFASLATYGTLFTFSTRDDLLNSRFIIVWGWNPAESVQDTNTMLYLVQAREAGMQIVAVDPRYTATAAALTDDWVPIRPGTDAAMLLAMAHVIIEENLQDQKFLDRYTLGFDRFKDYVLGIEDGVAKNPSWAEGITGVPANTIIELARKYATLKPAALMAGISPGRTAFGEQYHRAAMALAAMTGNVGIHGGHSAGRSWAVMVDKYPFQKIGKGMSGCINPVEQGSPPRPDAITRYRHGYSFWAAGRVNLSELADAILLGKSGGYPADYKMLYIVDTNPINQFLNTNKMIQAFNRLEFIVVHEQLMTATAKFADIVLPTSTMMERNDITLGGAIPFYGYQRKIIEPLYESKSHLEIFVELAKRLGVKEYSEKGEGDWLKDIARDSEIPDFKNFEEEAVYRIKLNEPYVAFKEQIEHPESVPFNTPSGKIEIYSQQLAEMDNPLIPPIPKYIDSWEGPNDPLTKKYPLQLITTHAKHRAHSQWETVPWLTELVPQMMLISTADAKARGIKDGDSVKVYNDRGATIIKAKVSERIMPGVVDIPQGAWFSPDINGIDRGGCPNVLTRDKRSPGGAFPSNTALVQVIKYAED